MNKIALGMNKGRTLFFVVMCLVEEFIPLQLPPPFS